MRRPPLDPVSRPIAPHDLPEPLDAALVALSEPPQLPHAAGERRYVRCTDSGCVIGVWQLVPPEESTAECAGLYGRRRVLT